MRKQVLIFGHDYQSHFIDIFNQYTRLFDKSEYEVTLVFLTGAANADIKERTLAEHVIFLNMPKKAIRGLKFGAIKTMLSLTKEKKFDIVICHRYKPIYIMLWVARFQKIAALFCVMHELKTMSALSRRLLVAALARKNVYFAGVSNAVRDDLRKDLLGIAPENIVTLYNVIDIELTEPKLLSREDARAALDLPRDAFVFGNLARLAANKDHATLINAFSEIKAKCANAKLVILGKGPLEVQLKSQVNELQLQDAVIFAGFVADGARYMRAFDCFVLSSIQEAFGRVLIEAMLARLPIIATRVHGIPEVVANVGDLVAAKDVSGLSQKMAEIYCASPEARYEIGVNVYRYVTENYSIPAFCRQFWGLRTFVVPREGAVATRK